MLSKKLKRLTQKILLKLTHRWLTFIIHPGKLKNFVASGGIDNLEPNYYLSTLARCCLKRVDKNEANLLRPSPLNRYRLDDTYIDNIDTLVTRYIHTPTRRAVLSFMLRYTSMFGIDPLLFLFVFKSNFTYYTDLGNLYDIYKPIIKSESNSNVPELYTGGNTEILIVHYLYAHRYYINYIRTELPEYDISSDICGYLNIFLSSNRLTTSSKPIDEVYGRDMPEDDSHFQCRFYTTKLKRAIRERAVTQPDILVLLYPSTIFTIFLSIDSVGLLSETTLANVETMLDCSRVFSKSSTYTSSLVTDTLTPTTIYTDIKFKHMRNLNIINTAIVPIFDNSEISPSAFIYDKVFKVGEDDYEIIVRFNISFDVRKIDSSVSSTLRIVDPNWKYGLSTFLQLKIPTVTLDTKPETGIVISLFDTPLVIVYTSYPILDISSIPSTIQTVPFKISTNRITSSPTYNNRLSMDVESLKSPRAIEFEMEMESTSWWKTVPPSTLDQKFSIQSVAIPSNSLLQTFPWFVTTQHRQHQPTGSISGLVLFHYSNSLEFADIMSTETRRFEKADIVDAGSTGNVVRRTVDTTSIDDNIPTTDTNTGAAATAATIDTLDDTSNTLDGNTDLYMLCTVIYDFLKTMLYFVSHTNNNHRFELINDIAIRKTLLTCAKLTESPYNIEGILAQFFSHKLAVANGNSRATNISVIDISMSYSFRFFYPILNVAIDSYDIDTVCVHLNLQWINTNMLTIDNSKHPAARVEFESKLRVKGIDEGNSISTFDNGRVISVDFLTGNITFYSIFNITYTKIKDKVISLYFDVKLDDAYLFNYSVIFEIVS